ncbi:MAG TPA: hypothetical protein VIK27_05265, partial [Candidatus Aquilonibacter sp.]
MSRRFGRRTYARPSAIRLLYRASPPSKRSIFGYTNALTWRFGISEVTTWPWTFEDDVRRYPALGAEAIEIWEFKLDGDAR